MSLLLVPLPKLEIWRPPTGVLVALFMSGTGPYFIKNAAKVDAAMISGRHGDYA